jgi:hypothetical protein
MIYTELPDVLPQYTYLIIVSVGQCTARFKGMSRIYRAIIGRLWYMYISPLTIFLLGHNVDSDYCGTNTTPIST